MLPHVGGRTTFKFEKELGTAQFNFDIGGEWQQGFNSVSVHKNVSGNADSLRTSDEINNRQNFVFAQALLDINNGWTIVAGASLNWGKINFTRFTPASLGKQTRRFSNEIAPRLAILKKISKVSIYSSVSKGFSPPTITELLPTGGAINLGLNAEDGINYDLGFKARLPKDFVFDVSAFIFHLDNTIVLRRDAGGGDFFVNAGKTDQKGIETALSYPLIQSSAFVQNSNLWFSHTWHHFRYKDFKQITADFSGNKLPGVPEHTISAGYDLFAKNGLSGTFTYYYSGKLPLNDANSQYADAYHLLGVKTGYQKLIKEKLMLKFFAGIENLLDERYSLGNDINGFGGRYYNAAAGRNYYGGLMITWLGKGVL